MLNYKPRELPVTACCYSKYLLPGLSVNECEIYLASPPPPSRLAPRNFQRFTLFIAGGYRPGAYHLISYDIIPVVVVLLLCLPYFTKLHMILQSIIVVVLDRLDNTCVTTNGRRKQPKECNFLVLAIFLTTIYTFWDTVRDVRVYWAHQPGSNVWRKLNSGVLRDVQRARSKESCARLFLHTVYSILLEYDITHFISWVFPCEARLQRNESLIQYFLSWKRRDTCSLFHR